MTDRNRFVDGESPSIEKAEPAQVLETPRTVSSEELFSGRRLVFIEHAGQQYRLLITRNDRLILQK
jgi:hemin uptake protein HemP